MPRMPVFMRASERASGQSGRRQIGSLNLLEVAPSLSTTTAGSLLAFLPGSLLFQLMEGSSEKDLASGA